MAVDGGMSDNPRPALYGVRFAPRLIGRPATAPLTPVTVVGRRCEAGDVLAEAELPADVRPGDLLTVPAAGADQLSMASAYNLVGRPPVVAVHAGRPACWSAASRSPTCAAATWASDTTASDI